MDDSHHPTVVAARPDLWRQLTDIAARVTEPARLDEVTGLLAETAVCVGADTAVFVSLMCDTDAWQSYRFIVAGSPNWCLEYEAQQAYLHDPWIKHARQCANPALAEDIPAGSAEEATVVRLAQSHGVASALIIPAHSPQGLTRLGALFLGSTHPGFFNSKDLQTITFLAMPLAFRLLDWQVRHLRRQLLSKVDITADELLLLMHQRQGHSSKEVGRALNFSATSVDSRWQRLNAKLGVSSRVAAARMAAEYGLI